MAERLPEIELKEIELLKENAETNKQTNTHTHTHTHTHNPVLEGKACSLCEQGYRKQPNAAKALLALTSHYRRRIF